MGDNWRDRCDWCGWPLAESIGQGCVADYCSQRPLPTRDDTALRQECRKAEADRDRLARELEEARAALRPFAQIEVPASARDGEWIAETKHCNTMVTAAMIRRARAVCKGD